MIHPFYMRYLSNLACLLIGSVLHGQISYPAYDYNVTENFQSSSSATFSISLPTDYNGNSLIAHKVVVTPTKGVFQSTTGTTLTYTPTTFQSGTDTFDWNATDMVTGEQIAFRATIQIEELNSPPVIESISGESGGSLSFSENQNLVTTVRISDPDSNGLSVPPTLELYVTGTHSQYFEVGSPSSSISSKYDYPINFKPTPDFETWEAANLISFSIDFNASDFNSSSDYQSSHLVSVTLSISDQNEAPVIQEGIGGSSPHTSISISEDNVPDSWPDEGVSLTAIDEDGDQVYWKFDTNRTNGTIGTITLKDSANSTVLATLSEGVYTAADFNTGTTLKAHYSATSNLFGSETLTFTVKDGSGLTDTFGIAVTVTQDSSDDSPSLNESSTIAVSFAENGTGQIHDFNPTDPDYPDVADEATLTYSLSGEDSSLFAISTGGVLTFNDAPDYDASTSADGDQTYELSVILSDGTGTADDSQDLEVTITNVDEAPDFSLSSPITFNLEEDTTWNWTDLASPLTASDPDSGDEATLSWQVETAPMFGATIDLNGTGSAPTTFNYQPKTDYSGSDTFVIKVADADGLSASLTFNVTISEVEEAPVITSFDGNATVSLQREENSPSTIQVSASDPDTGDTISYSIVGGADQAKFTIDSSSGDLTFSDTQPDYESPSDSGNNNVYEVQVRAQDASGNSDEQVFNVQITDVDESPYFTTNGSLSFVENSQYVTDVNASATDATDSGTIDFSLPAVSNSLDRVKFDVNASSGVLTFVSAPNFESPTDSNADNSYIVIVRATDSGGSAFLDLEHNITIVDANDAPVITSTDTFPITEGLTLVANLTASDQDSGEVLSWSIIDGNDTFFNLESNGTLSFKNASDNDFESGVGYTLTVQVTDTGGASDSQVISIQPLNTNESPSFRSEVVTESSDEDIDFRGHDLNQYVSDPEGDTLTFTLLTSNDNAFVTADGNFSLIAQANDSGTVDLNVSVSDGLLTDIMLIRVSFLPVNDDPVISDETMWSGLIYVDENMDANTDVIDLNLTDVDDSELNGIYEWEILPKDGNASHNDYKLFTILSTGGVRFIESPDFEDDLSVSGENKYEFDVNASDSSGGSHLITLRIKVQDLDEQLKQNLTLIPTINTSEETEVNGSLIGTVTDPEGQPLSYSLEVNASKGTINLNSDGTFVYIPNKNETGSDSAEFRIADTSGQSVNVASSFIINGVNDPPAIDAVAGGLVEIAENTPRDTVIYDLNLTDPDDTDANVSNSYLWSLYPKADDFNHTDYLKFQLDPTTGQLRFLSSPDRESDLSAGQINRYEMKIYATDPTDLNSSVDLTILVTNVEEPPLASKPSIFATNEEVEIKDNLLNYVTDPEGSQLTFTLLREPSNGEITYFDPTEGNFTYIPNTDFFGNDFFEFNASDNTNQFLEINCSVTVNNVEDAPVVTIIENDRILIPENFSATSVLYDFNHTDADEANASNPLGLYEWEIGPPSTDLNSMDYQFLYLSKYEGELKFQESPDYENNKTTDNVFQISVKVTDSQGLHGSYDLRVQVQDVDEPPVLSESYTGSFDTMEDTDLSINLSEFIMDPEGLSMTFSQTTPDSNITGTIRDLVTSSGSFIYSPKPQESGMDDFNFTVTDINSNTIPVSIFVNVIDQNDAPVIDEVPANLITVLENTSASVTIYDFNATDEDDTDGNASNDLVFWSLRQISGEIDPFDYFYVNSGNGKLRFINPPDYEDGKSIGSTIQQMNDYKLTLSLIHI